MRIYALPLLLIFVGCTHLKPYQCGPTMDQKGIEMTFGPLIKRLDIKSGDTFADVGASSGNYTIMMSTLMNDVSIYVEDVDTSCLNAREFDKVVDYYSKQSHHPLRQKNRLHYIIGTSDKTLLPDGAFDCIYTNATFHVFSDADAIVKDLQAKLKPTGALFIRDSFQKGDKIEHCTDPKCARQLVRADSMVAVLTRNGFNLESHTEFSGYPLYKFVKKAA